MSRGLDMAVIRTHLRCGLEGWQLLNSHVVFQRERSGRLKIKILDELMRDSSMPTTGSIYGSIKLRQSDLIYNPNHQRSFQREWWCEI